MNSRSTRSVDSSRLPSRNVSPTKLFSIVKGRQGPVREKPGTNFLETLMHHFKGNIGAGIFCLGEATKNAGIIFAIPGIMFLGFLNLHCQHLLLQAADQVAFNHEYQVKPDYAETIMVCFMDGPERFRNLAFKMKKLCNVFLIILQMGFCAVYIVFMSESVLTMLDMYGIKYNIKLIMLYTAPAVVLTALISNLKYMAPMSVAANLAMLLGIAITFYYNSVDLPDFNDREYIGTFSTIPLFFGTVLYTFEGIGLVLPMYNEMQKPRQFVMLCGVLNIGMTVVILLCTSMGVMSYWKWGDEIKPSVTLNLPPEILGMSVICLIAVGIFVTYILQLYVAFAVLFPNVYRKWGPFNHPYIIEFLFRSFLTLIAYALAMVVPYLGLIISLVGAMGGGFLAMIFPPILELIVFYEYNGIFTYVKDAVILIVGLAGIILCTYCSTREIVFAIMDDYHLGSHPNSTA